MKKIKTVKGYIIAEENETYYIYTKDEWAYGKGFRTEEWEAGSLQEAIEWIN